jgi:ACS family hexuronate transporter-like MFS transporter
MDSARSASSTPPAQAVPGASVLTSVSSAVTSAGYIRWIVCALLFFAATINYIDRQVISILKPTLQQQFHWSELDYADIVFTFQLAYAIGFLIAGPLVDRLGTKRGFSIAIVVWTLAAVGHAQAVVVGPLAAGVLGIFGLGYSTSVAGFMFMRLLLGLGESGNFPASIKAVAEWFPKRERALATGIFNSGTNIGALVTPLIVPWITINYGWAWAFIATGLLGFLWLIVWWLFYAPPSRHASVSGRELAYIRSDPVEATVAIPWRRVVPHRQAWAFAAGKFLTDPVWWLYLFWIPDFFSKNYGLDLKTIGPPVILVYLLADVGSIAGGWLSSRLIALGWTVNRARKTAMLACALAVLPVMFASSVHNLWLAAGIIGVAAAAHQGWSCNLFTLTSDTFPRPAIGSVVGFGGMLGAVGGMLISKVTGYLLEFSGSYLPVFIMAGCAYLVALGVIHLLVPRLEPVKLD